MRLYWDRMFNLGTNRVSARYGWPIAIGVPVMLLLIACPRSTGGEGDSDAEVVDAAPPPTTHVVLLHTADTIGYVEPCG